VAVAVTVVGAGGVDYSGKPSGCCGCCVGLDGTGTRTDRPKAGPRSPSSGLTSGNGVPALREQIRCLAAGGELAELGGRVRRRAGPAVPMRDAGSVAGRRLEGRTMRPGPGTGSETTPPVNRPRPARSGRATKRRGPTLAGRGHGDGAVRTPGDFRRRVTAAGGKSSRPPAPPCPWCGAGRRRRPPIQRWTSPRPRGSPGAAVPRPGEPPARSGRHRAGRGRAVQCLHPRASDNASGASQPVPTQRFGCDRTRGCSLFICVSVPIGVLGTSGAG